MPGLFNGVIMRLTLRAPMSRKRALLFAVPAIILIGISALLKATATGDEWPPLVLGQIGYLVLALTALIIGGSVLGAAIEDGSIVHLPATPGSRGEVVVRQDVNATLTAGTGIGMGLVVTAVALVVAVNRLSGFSLKGDVA